MNTLRVHRRAIWRRPVSQVRPRACASSASTEYLDRQSGVLSCRERKGVCVLGALSRERCHSSIHSSALPTDASAAPSSLGLMHRRNLGPCTDICGTAVRYAAAVGQLSRAALDELVADAVVDAYNDDEQLTGLYTMIEESLAMPFDTRVLGVEVTVRRVDLQAEGIVAICQRGRDRQAIGILELPLPDPAPEGAQWIAAYRHWAGR